LSEERWYTVLEIASKMQVHEQTVRRWIKKGDLPAVLFGRKGGYRVRESDLDAFLSAQFEKQGKAAA
jgi:excisionase family DNA binding protein